MKIGLIGNYQNGYVGEVADETHIARELETLGHVVTKINRDEWREYVIEDSPKGKYKVPEDTTFDVVLVCKWHHFYDGRFIKAARIKYHCAVVYWTWDFMDYDENWHLFMAREADLFLTNEGGRLDMINGKGVKGYYFPFDCADSTFIKTKVFEGINPVYELGFFGSWLQQGDRIELIKEINKQIKVHVWAYNPEKWQMEGIEAESAVYGERFIHEVNKCKVVLGINVNDHCWGYWSNRVGKTFLAGGCLLQRYVPGMELFLKDGAEYFTTAQDAVDKYHRIVANGKRNQLQRRALEIGKDQFTSAMRCKQLTTILERII